MGRRGGRGFRGRSSRGGRIVRGGKPDIIPIQLPPVEPSQPIFGNDDEKNTFMFTLNSMEDVVLKNFTKIIQK